MTSLRELYDRYQGDKDPSEDSANYWNNWMQQQQQQRRDDNSTATEGDQMTYSSGDTATVLILAVLLFVLVSVSIACVRLREAQHQAQRRAHLASDGNTVAASVEGEDDLEEGPGKSLSGPANDEKDMSPVVVVIVVQDGEVTTWGQRKKERVALEH